MTNEEIKDNIADSQPERQSENQAIERAKVKWEVPHNGPNHYEHSMARERATNLEACLKDCDTFDDFCEKCNKLINKQDELPRDLWNEYWESNK